MSEITIYHNPKCGTSRNVLAMIRANGQEPRVVEYLKTPPTRDDLHQLVQSSGLPARALLRSKEPLYAELQLADPNLSDEALLNALLTHPILLNRPIVTTPKGTRVCRPAELVQDLLPSV